MNRFGWALLAVAAAGRTVLAICAPDVFVPDDGYFYLVIARNAATGGGLTFHGLAPTNGYHPLWLAICTAFTALAGGNRVISMTLILAVQGALGAAGIALYARALSHAGLRNGLVAAAVAGALLFTNPTWCSEASLNLAAQALALAAVVRADAKATARGSVASWALAGAAVGVAVLARLDLVFLAGLTVVYAARAGRRPAAACAMSIVILVAPYVLANLFATGHLVPVSGATKSTFPIPDVHYIFAKLGWQGSLLITAAVAGLPFALRRRDVLGRAWAWLSAGALLHAVYTAVFTRWGWSTDYTYYYLTSALAAGIGAALLVDAYLGLLPSLGARAKVQMPGLLASIVAVASLGRGVSEAVRSDGARVAPAPAVLLARWMGQHLPPHTRVWTADAPGRLAWWSGLNVVAQDGLTSDYAFDGDVCREGITAWLDAHGINAVVAPMYTYAPPWLASSADTDNVSVRVFGPRTRCDAGVLLLRIASRRVDTATMGPRADERVGLWAWPPDP